MSENDQRVDQDDTEDPIDLAEAADDKSEDAEGASDDKDVAVLKDRMLRLAAELENTRRRADREKTDAGRYAIASFARDLIGVADNFDRALAATKDDGPASPEALKGIVEGLRMTEKELHTVLERHGVRRVSPSGERFDPNLHQAVAQTPHDTIPAGHVIDVVQAGFTIAERVLRAAMVTVSSGASKQSDDESAAGLDKTV